MLIRIVKMTFKEENVATFLELFNESKEQIRHFEGCVYLELMSDYNNPNSYSTYSKWQDETALNNYRNSNLFDNVWSKTKSLFSQKPIAISLKSHTKVS